ncbi:MAG: two-component system response regulator [Nitrospinae bacterium CG11_big_fil_rev_8_21_14_0_20_56_8]|nr:MAG: two-component system response regulator [Nitrospinae bacterium CG11_big_fil_rev_8_21_14_0_20_56_8]
MSVNDLSGNFEQPLSLSGKPPMLSPKTILVVDDDHLSRTLVSRILKKEGYAIQLAANGREAIDRVTENPPDLAVVDVLMPQVSGMEFLRWLREHHQQIPVIMLTSIEENSRLASEARELGVRDFFTKPGNYKHLLETIHKILP